MLFANANSKLVRILTELLDEEHKKRIAARRRVKELEALLDESESKTDAYSAENVGLRRKLSLALTGEEKEKLLRENEQLEKEKCLLKERVDTLIRMNEFLHNKLYGLTKELADGELRKANDYLLTRIATLEKEKKALAQSVKKA